MPLIRYENNDLAIWSNNKCSCGRNPPLLQYIEGRAYEMLTVPNGKKIHVSEEKNLQNSIINLGQDITRMYDMPEIEQRFIKASRAHYAISSSALAYCRLAEGKINVAVHPRQPFWDIGPGKILIEEAGGKITNWDGEQDFVITRERKNNIIASNGWLHGEALQLLQNLHP